MGESSVNFAQSQRRCCRLFIHVQNETCSTCGADTVHESHKKQGKKMAILHLHKKIYKIVSILCAQPYSMRTHRARHFSHNRFWIPSGGTILYELPTWVPQTQKYNMKCQR